ncbi:Lysophospholipase L2 [hydrothermal vent metagenome]|uniref:Lysophospholipase L2 n=1 Tax=hydrothermal vent metagenome TaxID=652676 RepID=A0A1W1BF95_9ZZZZ
MRIVLVLFITFSWLFGFEYWQYIDKHYKFTTEKELAQKYESVISPYFYKHKLHYFTASDNVAIAYKIFSVTNPKAIIVISSGRTEGMVKYQELLYDLNQNGYSVYILDHRGQGYSQRLVEDKQMGYVDNFFHYVDDLKFFVSNYVPHNKKRILLGHSMGGAIAALYVERYRDDFDALILSSPMCEPSIVVPSMSGFFCKLVEKKQEDAKRYIRGTASYDILNYEFDGNDLTHSKKRFEIMKKAYVKEPQTRVGGPSLQWLKEACKWSAVSVEKANLITIPVLLLQGENDSVVTHEAQIAFCQRALHCKGVTIKGAYHELFIEKDTIRQKALTAILNFISKI